MQRRSPPAHRHDGTSPLPLGMDWSPPPRKWNGKNTIWPHDPRSGWSYCVTIPSWVVLPKSRDSDPVVFYRVQVGIQSPEGITTTHRVLRRFNDFMKLFTDLKIAFSKKSIPTAPPKGLLRMKTRALLEERKISLEEWMTKLLCDIDISRSVAVASFLELEAAARSSFEDDTKQTSETNTTSNITSSSQQLPQLGLSVLTGSSSSVTPDYGSDTAYETSELGTPTAGRDENSEIADDLTLDEDMTGPIEKLVKCSMSNIDEGLFMGQTILEQLEGAPRHKVHARLMNNILKDGYNGNSSNTSFLVNNGLDLFSEPERRNITNHARKASNESVGSDTSSLRGSEMSSSGIPNTSVDGSHELPGGVDSSAIRIQGNTEFQLSIDTQVVLPLDQRQKMNRVLLTMQRRLVTAKNDMEDLIGRLNQEIAVKDYLTTKVKDLEEELETTKQKSKENLQQALLIERERVTQMQWDMEELRHKSFEMELKLKSEQGKSLSHNEEDAIQQKLNTSKERLDKLSKQYEELEAKSKAETKLLVKEVKSLRRSQAELKQELANSRKKSEAEISLRHEKEARQRANVALKMLFQESATLQSRLEQLKVGITSEFEGGGSSIADVNHLTASADQIRSLLAEVQHWCGSDQPVVVSGVPEAQMSRSIPADEMLNFKMDMHVKSANADEEISSPVER